MTTSETPTRGYSVSLGLLDGHARVCMVDDGHAGGANAAQVDELMGAVGRLLRA